MSKSILSIFYRGPENFVSVISSSRVNYTFSRDTDFTVTPETWEDFYEILLLDKMNVRDRLYVVSADPISSTNMRRVPVEERFVSQEVIDNQAEVDAQYSKKAEFNRYKNEYIGRINLQIARGEIDMIPKNLEADAESYADEQYIIQNTPVEPVVETPVETSAETPVVEATLPPMTEEAPVPGAPIESQVPVVEDPVIETPVETAPVETPVVETTEVLENTSELSPDTVTELPAETPTPESSVEETPTETPVETTAGPVVETPVKETAPKTTSKKKSS